jgi:hypothetical protein
MLMSLFRVFGGILTGVIAIAALWALTWYHPRLGCSVMLSAAGIGWGWHLNRLLKTGRIYVSGRVFLAAKTPVAYWFWFGIYFLIGCYFIVGGTYALIKFG